MVALAKTKSALLMASFAVFRQREPEFQVHFQAVIAPKCCAVATAPEQSPVAEAFSRQRAPGLIVPSGEHR
jgi:hypothetical protein